MKVKVFAGNPLAYMDLGCISAERERTIRSIRSRPLTIQGFYDCLMAAIRRAFGAMWAVQGPRNDSFPRKPYKSGSFAEAPADGRLLVNIPTLGYDKRTGGKSSGQVLTVHDCRIKAADRFECFRLSDGFPTRVFQMIKGPAHLFRPKISRQRLYTHCCIMLQMQSNESLRGLERLLAEEPDTSLGSTHDKGVRSMRTSILTVSRLQSIHSHPSSHQWRRIVGSRSASNLTKHLRCNT